MPRRVSRGYPSVGLLTFNNFGDLHLLQNTPLPDQLRCPGATPPPPPPSPAAGARGPRRGELSAVTVIRSARTATERSGVEDQRHPACLPVRAGAARDPGLGAGTCAFARAAGAQWVSREPNATRGGGPAGVDVDPARCLPLPSRAGRLGVPSRPRRDDPSCIRAPSQERLPSGSGMECHVRIQKWNARGQLHGIQPLTAVVTYKRCWHARSETSF